MSSPFQKAFSAKSPLGNHKKIQRKIDMLRKNPEKAERKGLSSESGGGIDYEAIAKLESQLAEAKASHNQTRTEEGDAKVREDEDAAQGSAAEMRSPLKKNSPLEGSYASPSGAPYVSHVGMIQNAVGAVQNALNSYMEESDENKAKRLQARVDNRKKRFDHETDEEGNIMGTDTSFINEKTQELQDRAEQHLDAANTSKSNEQLKKLQDALAAGTITQAQYNQLIK
tara:strand:- start:21 stop:701 length:681 start_codon:yes stop_codon:yes gene_type:complete